MKWLIFSGGEIPLVGQELNVGRDAGCEVKLEEHIASRRHASFFERQGEYVLVDNTSRNGTFVNGKRITGPTALHHKDTVSIGKTEFLFAEWTPTPGSKTDATRHHDFALSSSTFDSSSGNATNTGANLICNVLYRSLKENNIESANRVIAAFSQRIAKRASSGELEAAELNMVAHAIIDYGVHINNVRWLSWLLDLYTRRAWFPKPSIASAFREAALSLGMTDTASLEQWVERTKNVETKRADEDASKELLRLLEQLGC